MARFQGAIDRRSYGRARRQPSSADAFPSIGLPVLRSGTVNVRNHQRGKRNIHGATNVRYYVRGNNRITSLNIGFGPANKFLNRGNTKPENRCYGIGARQSKSLFAFPGLDNIANRRAKPENRLYTAGSRQTSILNAFRGLEHTLNRGSAKPEKRPYSFARCPFFTATSTSSAAALHYPPILFAKRQQVIQVGVVNGQIIIPPGISINSDGIVFNNAKIYTINGNTGLTGGNGSLFIGGYPHPWITHEVADQNAIPLQDGTQHNIETFLHFKLPNGFKLPSGGTFRSNY